MSIYRKVCYLVEDLFVRILTAKKTPEDVLVKVQQYRYNEEMRKQNSRMIMDLQKDVKVKIDT
jgi:hypothetical protein